MAAVPDARALLAQGGYLAGLALTVAAPQLYDALRSVEWVRDGFDWRCPSCRRVRSECAGADFGHRADCPIALALAKASGQ